MHIVSAMIILRTESIWNVCFQENPISVWEPLIYCMWFLWGQGTFSVPPAHVRHDIYGHVRKSCFDSRNRCYHYKMGFTAPIVLYSSKIDYTQLPDLPPNVILRRSHIFLVLCQSFWLWVMPMYRGILKRYPCILLMDTNIIFRCGILCIIHPEKTEMPSIWKMVLS